MQNALQLTEHLQDKPLGFHLRALATSFMENGYADETIRLKSTLLVDFGRWFGRTGLGDTAANSLSVPREKTVTTHPRHACSMCGRPIAEGTEVEGRAGLPKERVYDSSAWYAQPMTCLMHLMPLGALFAQLCTYHTGGSIGGSASVGGSVLKTIRPVESSRPLITCNRPFANVRILNSRRSRL